MIRIGHGFDVHKFGGEGPVIIGGVSIPYEQGLVAHSDGDVALHAVCDACWGQLQLAISAVISRTLTQNGKGQTAAFYCAMCSPK